MQIQKKINKLSLEWCLPMPFGGEKDKTLGVGNWQSDHCSAFTRISLYQFSTLDAQSTIIPPEDVRVAVCAYRRMSVIWFCLVSNAFTHKNINATRVDHLVRLFLSSCKDFHYAAYEDDRPPFYQTKSNYYSLLNCKEIIERYGSLRYLWEGGDEKFIQMIKREISSMRYDVSYLKVLLEKLLSTSVLESLNFNNPLRSKIKYARLRDFNVYRSDITTTTPSLFLIDKEYITGLIDEYSKMYLCFERSVGSGISLCPISFDDSVGIWILNMWYARADVGCEACKVADRHELMGRCKDSFLMLKVKTEVHNDNQCNQWTVICHSWKVRINTGCFELPMPRKEYHSKI